ncbi:MAG: OmpA family protein [Nitrospira sp.]|nr:OmpA family protein [Nitrospira sp.]
MISRTFDAAVLCSLLVAAAACSQPTIRAAGEFRQPAPGASLQDDETEQIVPEPIVGRELPQASVRRMEEEHRMEQAGTAAAGLRDAFFAYDSWDLDKENMRALTENANWLLAHRDTRLRIEGHCDERGSTAYNLVLGERRALAVREFLTDLGVATQRLAIMSYGESQPVCREPRESCYRENRRGHLVVKP